MQSINSSAPSFFIAGIPVYGNRILAPMDGYSDQPFRSVTRELGSAMIYTEFINALEIVWGNKKFARRCLFSEPERPVAIQVFDDNPVRLTASAISIVEQFSPDMIDINMGCSVNHVANRGAGAGLLQDPKKVGAIIANLTHELKIPVTAKIRLGWDQDSINYLEVGKQIEGNGAAMVALHARTKAQLFSGSIDLDAIANLKQTLTIPVLGNGDLACNAEIEAMLSYTKCDGVLIGRSAIKNPWIFAGFDFEDVPLSLYLSTIRKHFTAMMAFYGPDRGCVVFRKFAKKYLTNKGIGKAKVRNLLTTVDPDLFAEKFETLVKWIEAGNRDYDLE